MHRASLRGAAGWAGPPELGEVDFVLVRGRRGDAAQEAADALAGAILAGGDRLYRGPGTPPSTAPA